MADTENLTVEQLSQMLRNRPEWLSISQQMSKQMLDGLEAKKHQQAREFTRHTDSVLRADSALRDTTEKLNRLKRDLVHLEETRQQVMRAVNQVREHQRSMEDTLVRSKEKLDRLYQIRGVVQDGGTAFRCAQDVGQVLQEMEKRLDRCVERLTGVQERRLAAMAPGAASTDPRQVAEVLPLVTIVQVLNEHFATLQWVGERTEALRQQTQKAKEQLERL